MVQRGDLLCFPVPDPVHQRSQGGGRPCDMPAATLFVSLQAGNAEPPQDRAGIPEQIETGEQGIGNERQECIQLQIAQRRGKRYGLVMCHDGQRSLGHRFGDDRIDFARHDRGPRLSRRKPDLADTGIRS